MWRWADGKLERGAFLRKYGTHANTEENTNILIDQRIVVQNVNSSKRKRQQKNVKTGNKRKAN